MKTSEAVLRALEARGLTLATAESCTGGMVGTALTAIPGSSKSYLGGVVSYTNGVKAKLVGVPQATLDAHGAVSRETAEAMAQGARKAIGADIGASVTGLAGPDGDGSGKPVGLVYTAVSNGKKTVCREHRFSGDRAAVRRKARNALLHEILEFVSEA
ncbi:MAG: nicotinamide-nucleotide amidohydrolase family protein [Oscillospiraceae bacterium]|nr:nicotinamide-nucleotide amidohydrolase family protein [Oscillospiraceae bacterium]